MSDHEFSYFRFTPVQCARTCFAQKNALILTKTNLIIMIKKLTICILLSWNAEAALKDGKVQGDPPRPPPTLPPTPGNPRFSWACTGSNAFLWVLMDFDGLLIFYPTKSLKTTLPGTVHYGLKRSSRAFRVFLATREP